MGTIRRLIIGDTLRKTKTGNFKFERMESKIVLAFGWRNKPLCESVKTFQDVTEPVVALGFVVS